MTPGRIVRSADFERVLRLQPRAKSAHFALHHLRGSPSRHVRRGTVATGSVPASVPSECELSTGTLQDGVPPVDDSGRPAGSAPVSGGRTAGSEACWLGTVVPKRHARRSVTRSLLKRQMHAAFDREPRLPAGLWVVRLRSPFDVRQFPSAASDALRLVVRQELDAMLAALMQRLDATERRG